jgi:hypothetical protein
MNTRRESLFLTGVLKLRRTPGKFLVSNAPCHHVVEFITFNHYHFLLIHLFAGYWSRYWSRSVDSTQPTCTVSRFWQHGVYL